MKKQQGASTAAIALVIVLVGAAGGGYYAWQQQRELMRARSELAEAKSALDKAAADARAAKTQADAARKELDEQKATLAQLKTKRDAAVAFLETEKAHAARIQADLTLAREQMAFLRSRSAPAAYSPPRLAPQPMPVPVLGNRGVARSAARAAQPAPIDAQPTK
jgi:uncharacterized protein HemX